MDIAPVSEDLQEEAKKKAVDITISGVGDHNEVFTIVPVVTKSTSPSSHHGAEVLKQELVLSRGVQDE